MGRLTRKEKCKLSNGKEIVICKHEEQDCNDSCMKIQPCAWYKKVQEKLWEYENAEEQGFLLRFPCQVGDTVYRINKGAKEPIVKMRVLQVHYKQLHKNRTILRIDAINDNDMGESCYLGEDIGKKVFLKKEEAEQKLKEMESD